MGLQEDLAYKGICETHGWEYNPRYIEIPDAFASKPQTNWQSYVGNAASHNGYFARTTAPPKPAAPRMTDEEREQIVGGLALMVGMFFSLPHMIVTEWLRLPTFMSVIAYVFIVLSGLSLVTQLVWGNFILWGLSMDIVNQTYIHIYYLFAEQMPG